MKLAHAKADALLAHPSRAMPPGAIESASEPWWRVQSGRKSLSSYALICTGGRQNLATRAPFDRAAQ